MQLSQERESVKYLRVSEGAKTEHLKNCVISMKFLIYLELDLSDQLATKNCLTVTPEICKNCPKRYFALKPILLNFVNLYTINFPKLLVNQKLKIYYNITVLGQDEVEDVGMELSLGIL